MTDTGAVQMFPLMLLVKYHVPIKQPENLKLALLLPLRLTVVSCQMLWCGDSSYKPIPDLSPDLSSELSYDLSSDLSPDLSSELSLDLFNDLSSDLSLDLSSVLSPYLSFDLSPDLSPDKFPDPFPDLSPDLFPATNDFTEATPASGDKHLTSCFWSKWYNAFASNLRSKTISKPRILPQNIQQLGR